MILAINSANSSARRYSFADYTDCQPFRIGQKFDVAVDTPIPQSRHPANFAPRSAFLAHRKK